MSSLYLLIPLGFPNTPGITVIWCLLSYYSNETALVFKSSDLGLFILNQSHSSFSSNHFFLEIPSTPSFRYWHSILNFPAVLTSYRLLLPIALAKALAYFSPLLSSIQTGNFIQANGFILPNTYNSKVFISNKTSQAIYIFRYYFQGSSCKEITDTFISTYLKHNLLYRHHKLNWT